MKKAVLTLLTLTAASAIAEARPARTSQIPNAPASCATCHISPGGGGPLNSFGRDVGATLMGSGAAGVVNWGALFDLDSDGDGATNGLELGDPLGAWTPGAPRPGGETSLPGDPSSTVATPSDEPPGPNDSADDPPRAADAGYESGGCRSVAGQTVSWPLLAVALLASWRRRRRRAARAR